MYPKRIRSRTFSTFCVPCSRLRTMYQGSFLVARRPDDPYPEGILSKYIQQYLVVLFINPAFSGLLASPAIHYLRTPRPSIL